MDPLPNVKTTFCILSREESHQKNGSLSFYNVAKTQSSTFNSKFNDNMKIQNQNTRRNQNLQCKNCGLKVHLIEKCYKLIGYEKISNLNMSIIMKVINLDISL